MTTLAALAITNLLTYVEQGTLPQCYTGVEDWLFDFWPELSWTAEITKDVQAILDDTNFPRIQQFFLERYKFDFEQELRHGVKDVTEA
jgi:hypothetical protein